MRPRSGVAGSTTGGDGTATAGAAGTATAAAAAPGQELDPAGVARTVRTLFERVRKGQSTIMTCDLRFHLN